MITYKFVLNNATASVI